MATMADLRRWAASHHPEMILGLGSVVDAETAVAAINAGADFIFGPSLEVEVAAACNGRNLPYVPGCGTLTEIQTAYRLGCDLVKLFPAESLGGPEFLTAVRAPCPWIQAVPTGGVSPSIDSLRAWFMAGAPAVGLGAKLFSTDAIESGDFAAVEYAVSQAVKAATKARQ
jgi:2-dehydro-3-deoxyphosphogluconate aldolase/(4S)-4-hydroxy-2-oxoglutarate aldolase